LRLIVRIVLKFRDPPVRIARFIAQTFEGKLQGRGYARDHGVLGPTRFQHVQHWPETEAGIGPHAEFPNIGRSGVKTKGQKFLAARPGSCIAASQSHIPKERGVRLQTEQRVRGPFASIAWVVTNRRSFLVTENRNDGVSRSRINRDR